MASFDLLPDELLVKIFSYLGIHDLSCSVRNVCSSWRRVSEDDAIWLNLRYCPTGLTPLSEINFLLENSPNLRQFHYTGSLNFIRKLCECCTKVSVLHIPYTTVTASDLTLAVRCLTELRDLGVYIAQVEPAVLLTVIISKCKTLVSLTLYPSAGNTAVHGLLLPIAEGCPNLTVLKCKARDSTTGEICYFLHRKKDKLVTYEYHGAVTTGILMAIDECTNLKSVSFFGHGTNGIFTGVPPLTKLQNLKTLEISGYTFPTANMMVLMLFHNTLSQLSYICLSYIGGNIDTITNAITLKCPLLTHLNVEGNELHCEGLRNIHSCKMLKYLDVSACVRVGKRGMTYVADGCPQLQHLDFSRNPVSERIFRQILRFKNLKTLLMMNCYLTDINLRLISTHINGLLYLLIGPEYELAYSLRNQLKREMPQLLIQETSFLYNGNEYVRMKSDPLPKYLS
ncbi:uncharacterized protein LOC117282321 [Cryptotermes secundus]|uniref:uncharacterized protein LOC117282321 n=1 Tax=Cryptotermes secundus TaxID=105785 RepID=UPI001454D2AC|nr:uncharacterized protein LOC117282321 [Cryptotermes secundus]